LRQCEGRLFSSNRRETRRYVCLSGPDHGGCGRLTVVADPLERFLADAVLYRLDTPELADALAGRSSSDHRAHSITQAVVEAQEQLEELPTAYGTKQITMREWMTAKKPIQERLESAQRQLSRITNGDSLKGLVGNGEELRRSWSALNLSRQHAIVAAVIDHAEIGPGTQGASKFDPGRVSFTWRH
jgi:hypothetical protein